MYRERSVQTTKTFPKASSLHQIFDQILNPEIRNKEKQNLTSELSTHIEKVAVKLYILEQKYYHEIPEKKSQKLQ